MALARALAVEPKVLLLDEPFGALDAKVRAELREWLRRLHDEVHVTTVLVTHDQEEAMAIADHIAVMDHGSIEQVGGPRELYDQPANGFVMRFLGPVSQVGDASCARTTSRSCSHPRKGPARRSSRGSCTSASRSAWSSGWTASEAISVQVTRNEADQLELAEGAVVWVRTGRRASSRAAEPSCRRTSGRPTPRARGLRRSRRRARRSRPPRRGRGRASACRRGRAAPRGATRAGRAAGAAAARRTRPSRRARRSPPCRRRPGRRRPRNRRRARVRACRGRRA